MAGSERKAIIPSPHHHRLMKAGFIGSAAMLALGLVKWLLSIHIRTCFHYLPPGKKADAGMRPGPAVRFVDHKRSQREKGVYVV